MNYAEKQSKEQYGNFVTCDIAHPDTVKMLLQRQW